MGTPLLTEIFCSIRDDKPRNLWREDESIDETKLREEVKYVIDYRDKLNGLISILFEYKEKTPGNIFNNIQEITAHLKFHDYANELAGNVFLEILTSLPQKDCEKIFKALLDTTTRHIWEVLHTLPFVFSHFQLDSTFAAEWFYKIGENIKQDLASGDFFNALDNYSYNFPEEGIKVFNIYLEQNFIGLQQLSSSIILGSLRAAVRKKGMSKNLITIEEKLKNSSDENQRLVYYKSWIATYSRDAASYEEVIEIIEQSIEGEGKEVNGTFFIIFRIVVKDLQNDKVILPLIEFLDNNVSNELPEESKFQVMSTLYWLISVEKNISKIRDRVRLYLSIFTKILPIESKYLGTWKKIEEVVSGLLEKRMEAFFEFLDAIIEMSFNTFRELLVQNHFEHLEYTLSNSIADDVFTKLIFSESEKDRLIAIELFRKLNDVSIKTDNIKPNEKVLSKLLLEFSRSVLLEKSSEFLLMIEPFFRSVDDELKQEFMNEMVFQAVNFRGACFEKWSKIENPSDIIKEVTTITKKYYEKLEKVSHLPARNFTYYKFVEGAELERKIQSRDLNKKVKEKSVFLSLVKHTQILYGDKWAIQNQVEDGSANKFGEISHSIEFPRIENIDPEGIVLKRMFISSALKNK